ncbi:carotenoid biosynthesis protein [Sediminibacterium roseum]|uniref:Carotenoid biosynthesis protein n=1 Tax=Sediminibacterium roseum TaxID=1978412 RepID=A0ABW9ZUN9_9BACT|nr:carotenoid biosynthesis protein [Sediminibacterium roseum]NCI48785.1 carotenoid biosynthesis protein [Sediminibacterium roseum]
MKPSRSNIAIFIALLFHVSGFVGMVFTPYKNWFVQNTPLNLCLMAALIIWTHEEKNLSFYFFFAIAFLVGMGTEMIGVNTGKLFGSYEYGGTLGPKFNNVPWLIGLNWVVVIFCVAAVMQKIFAWMKRKMEGQQTVMPKRIQTLSLLVDGATLAAFFDWVMEPVAIKLGYWQWKNNEVPLYNYVCWFAISFVLLLIMRWMRFQKANHFAVQLFIIQLLFFMALRIYLV